jgi:Mg2+/Co2+ transporter CorC
MSLDKLWNAVKDLKYPINDADQLEELLGDLKIKFDDEELDARSIALAISEYPIKSAPDLIRDFLTEEESYSTEEAEAVGEMIEEAEKEE